MATITANVFPGSLSMTEYTLTTASSLTNDSSWVVQDSFNYYNAEYDRTGVVVTANITYYIQITADIKSHISHHAANTIQDADGNLTADDTWSLTAINYASTDSGLDVSFNLPTFTDKLVPLKNYYAKMMNDNSANTGVEWQYDGDATWNSFSEASGNIMAHVFDLDIKLSGNTDGLLSATCQFYDASGDGFKVRVPENIAFAQVLSLDFSDIYSVETAPADASAINQTSDTLTYATISASDLNSQGATKAITIKRNAVVDLYAGQHIFTAWGVAFDAQDASGRAVGNYNAITKYARDNDWTTAAYGFNTGDRIVAETPKSFSLSVDDMSGNAVELIAATNIYGVIRQSQQVVRVATAFFFDSSGNSEEISRAVYGSVNGYFVSITTTLSGTIVLFGLKTSDAYDEDKIVLRTVSGGTYTWEFLV